MRGSPATAALRYLGGMTETKSPQTALQAVAEAAAKHVAEAVASFLYLWKKPATAGAVVAKEVVMRLSPRELAPPMERIQQEHFQPAAGVICDTIRSRGVPHSWIAPTWNRAGVTLLADSTASVDHPCTGAPYSDAVIVRAVIYRGQDSGDNVELAVLFSPRFAAE